MNSYTFNNRFVFDNKKVMAGILFKLIMSIIGILLIAQLIMNGFSVMTVFIPIFVISLFIPKGPPTFEADILTRVSIENGVLTISYMNLDRHDKLGIRNEYHTILPTQIKKIRYNDKYFKLQIVSKGLVKITNSSNEVIEKDYQDSDESCQNILYLTDEVREPLLQMIKSICDNNAVFQKK